MHVRVVHETCTKHRLEGHEISCTNIIFHSNQYVLLLHHVFMAINKIKITCFDLQAMTASRSVQVPHCSLRTQGVVTYSSFKQSVKTSKVTQAKIVHLIVFLNNQSQQVSMFNNQSNECISFDKQSHMTCDAFKQCSFMQKCFPARSFVIAIQSLNPFQIFIIVIS